MKASGDDGPRSTEDIPVRFEDLRRDTAQDRARFSADLRRRAARTEGLIGNQAFMDASRRVSVAATLLGGLLILAGVRAPVLEAVRTLPGLVDATGEMTRESLDALEPTVTQVLAEARAVHDNDRRGAVLARKGLACLDGTGLCPNGRSPLR